MTKPKRKVRKHMKATKRTARLVIHVAALELPDNAEPATEAVLVVMSGPETPIAEIPVPPTAFQKLLTWWRG